MPERWSLTLETVLLLMEVFASFMRVSLSSRSTSMANSSSLARALSDAFWYPAMIIEG
jgi:hypothetical protein